MLTHEIEARKRLHDHVMEDSDRRRSRVEKPNQPSFMHTKHAVQSSLLSHAARATIRPARFVRMRTFAIAINIKKARGAFLLEEVVFSMAH